MEINVLTSRSGIYIIYKFRCCLSRLPRYNFRLRSFSCPQIQSDNVVTDRNKWSEWFTSWRFMCEFVTNKYTLLIWEFGLCYMVLPLIRESFCPLQNGILYSFYHVFIFHWLVFIYGLLYLLFLVSFFFFPNIFILYLLSQHCSIILMYFTWSWSVFYFVNLPSYFINFPLYVIYIYFILLFCMFFF